jgi:hypothetical protein
MENFLTHLLMSKACTVWWCVHSLTILSEVLLGQEIFFFLTRDVRSQVNQPAFIASHMDFCFILKEGWKDAVEGGNLSW